MRDLKCHDIINLNKLKCLCSAFSPWRIVDDCGGAFTMGAIGGGIFQAVKGFRNAPSVSSRTVFWPQSKLTFKVLSLGSVSHSQTLDDKAVFLFL